MSTPILDNVLSCPELPTLPTVAVELLELTRDPDVEVGDIADLVQHDQALTSKILKTVNSSYYSLAQPCPTIKRALAYLGLSTVKSLVLGFSLVDLTRKCNESFDLIDYWKRCLYSAAAARRIAMTTGACDPEEVFIAALMQDIGMLAMHAALRDDYGTVLNEAKGNHFLLPRCETAALGFTHAEAGALLGKRWHLPDQLVEPIRYHHRGGALGHTNSPMVNAVILAYRVSHLLTTPDRKPALAMVDAMSQALFHMSVEEERATLEYISADVEELSSLLEVNVGDFPDVGRILAEADEALREHEQDTQHESEQVRPSNEAQEEMTDPLTAVGNRTYFDQQLSTRFGQAFDQETNLALILVDVDRLTSLNDTFGHRAGDEVLRQIAQRLRAGTGRAGLVCRYGGDLFAVLVPGVSRVEAARMAERLRRLIEQNPVSLHDSGGDTEFLQVTASLGVAAFEPQVADHLNRPGLLVQVADKARSAAKRSGQNRVRVFNPTPPSSSAA